MINFDEVLSPIDNIYKPLDARTVSSLEEQRSVTLPGDFVEFFSIYGAAFVPGDEQLGVSPERTVQYFFGAPGCQGGEIKWEPLAGVNDEIQTLSFARDLSDNIYFLNFQDGAFVEVSFWMPSDDSHSTVAATFGDFLASLHLLGS